MRKLFLIPGLLFISVFAFPQSDNIPERPSPQRMVNNLSKEFPNFLSSVEQSQLESRLVAFNDSTSNQIAIVIVDDFGGMDQNSFETQLFNKWGIGRAKEDNGVLILIKPTGKPSERKIDIMTGYGMEAAIPDITARHIVEKEITPEFKNGNYFQGLNKGVDKIMGLAQGEFNSEEYEGQGGNIKGMLKYVIIAIIILILLSRVFRGGGGMTMSRMGTSFIGGSFFGGGGGGGGGFGGFGGGSSGGGGAGGSW